jgi:hypothetical protein
LLIFAIPAALQQERHSPIVKHARRGLSIDWARVFIVAAMLIVALVANVVTNLHFPQLLGRVSDASCSLARCGGPLSNLAADGDQHTFAALKFDRDVTPGVTFAGVMT